MQSLIVRLLKSATSRLCLMVGLLSGLVACSHDAPVLSGATMGTTYNIIVPGLRQSHQAELALQIDASLAKVNAAMSTYQQDSAISRFNASHETDWFVVSEDFLQVTEAALAIADQSNGAFDPTVGPLVRRWGFSKDSQNSVPTAEEISQLLANTGFARLQVDAKTSSIKKTITALQLDLNAIAKGYAVDLLAADVEAFGYQDYLVEIGGELRVSGENAKHEPWRIGIERPDTGALATEAASNTVRQAQAGLHLTAGAVATSGDYRNAFESDGVRYSHIIDARSGKPVSHNLASVTVVADSAMMADGWATALMVLGPEQGLQIAEQLGLAGYFIVRDPGRGFVTRSSKAFAALVRN